MPSNRSFIFWLQSIYHINTCRKPSFPMNVSFILTLIVEATLSLVQQVFIDSVNFIVQTCNFKNKQICHYSLMKETVKLHQLSTSLQVNLEVRLKEFWKCILLNRVPTSTKVDPPPNPDLDFSNFNPKIHFWTNLGPKSQICTSCLKIGTHSISRMLILIPTLNFWISNAKIRF